jgi:hypothetical protein
MAFDDIPEDREVSHPCVQYDDESPNQTCPGNVTKYQGRWACDVCKYDYGGDSLAAPDLSDV